MASFADQLFGASEDESLSPGELRAWMRRAAMRLSESELDADYLALIRDMNEACQETFRANDALRDRLIAHGELPIDAMDEDTETKGSA